MKPIIIFGMAILMLSMVNASPLQICEDAIEINSNCTMVTPAINCSYPDYEIMNLSEAVVGTGSLETLYADVYQFNFTEQEGDYIVRLCDGTTRQVRVKSTDGGNLIIAVIILLPMLLAVILLVGAATMNAEQHSMLKIFLFLLSILPFFVSMHFAALSVIKFYNFTELQDIMGTTVYWVGVAFFVIIVYFLIFAIYRIFTNLQQQKDEEMNY